MTLADVHSLVLPPLSLALMGAGPEGAHFIEQQFGLTSADFDGDFRRMLSSLEESQSPEAGRQRDASLHLAALAAEVTGWFAVTSLTELVQPTYVLRRDDVALTVRPVGPVVEWLLLEVEDVAQLVEEAATAFGGGVLVLSWQAGRPKAAILLEQAVLRVAATSRSTLDRLSVGAGTSLREAVHRIWAALG